jgi:hypothetical protein
MERDRAIRLVIWAAKCHTHSQRSEMPLGRLPHTPAEVDEAIRVVEAYQAHVEVQTIYDELTHDTALGG